MAIQRPHLNLTEVKRTFDTCMSSIGFNPDYWQGKITNATDNFGRVFTFEMNRDVVTRLIPIVIKAYGDGIAKEFKDDLVKDGYEMLVMIADANDMWRDHEDSY